MSNLLESFTVAWDPVHQYATRLAASLGVDLGDRLPVPGTLGWLALPDDDPVKHAALLLAGSRDILRLENDQEAKAEASKDIAGAADWAQVGREVQQREAARRSGVRIERRADV